MWYSHDLAGSRKLNQYLVYFKVTSYMRFCSERWFSKKNTREAVDFRQRLYPSTQWRG